MGEPLAGDAPGLKATDPLLGTGWAALQRTVRDYDREKVEFCRDDINTLLVFVSLFLSHCDIASDATYGQGRCVLGRTLSLCRWIVSKSSTGPAGGVNRTFEADCRPDIKLYNAERVSQLDCTRSSCATAV